MVAIATYTLVASWQPTQAYSLSNSVALGGLFSQALSDGQRHPRRTGKRGRPEYLYGVGDFSHVTHPPTTTVPYIGGEDDPAWGPRPEVI